MKTLLFLHGALGDKSQWLPVLDVLKNDYEIHTLNFPGHGMEDNLYDSDLNTLCAHVENYTVANKLTDFAIIGYSLGGYVALMLAIHQLKNLSRVITLATKMEWNPEIADVEIKKLNEVNLQPIAGKLEWMHGKNWPDVLIQTHMILESIGLNPITAMQMERICIPVSMLIGEKDKMVSQQETIEFASAAPKGDYRLLPGLGHLLERMDTGILSDAIREIMSSSGFKEKT